MGLIGNYNVLSKSPCRFRSGTTVSSDRSNFSKSGSLKNRFYGDEALGMNVKNAIPVGYNPHYTWAPAQSGGGLGSYTINTAAISLTTASLLSGKALESAFSGSIVITSADLAKIVSLLASLSASGTLTNAQLAAISQLEASLSASGTFTDADISAFANLVASLTASGTFTTVNDIALAYMEASISSTTPLSPESLAAAVWSALAADYNVSGTMGERMNDAGASGDPLSNAVPAAYADGTAGKQIGDLLTVAKFLGLK